MVELILYGFILYGPEGQLAWKVQARDHSPWGVDVRRYGVTPDGDVTVRVRVWQPPPNVERPSVVVCFAWGGEGVPGSWYFTFMGKDRTIAYSDIWPPNGSLAIVERNKW